MRVARAVGCCGVTFLYLWYDALVSGDLVLVTASRLSFRSSRMDLPARYKHGMTADSRRECRHGLKRFLSDVLGTIPQAS